MDSQLPESAGLKGATQIGEGGNGTVYQANHVKFGAVAVKIAIEQGPAAIQSFISEYSLLRSLRHPGIIRLLDFGYTLDSRPYMVMELLAGGNLYEHADRLPLTERFHSLGKIISALTYLHNLGVVHRDLKGENILLDQNHQARITDLGLAAQASDLEAGRSGTIEYMAPEVCNNQGASTLSDIYSLGVILYRVATSRLPFESSDPLQVISLKQQTESLLLEQIESTISPRFTELLRRCLQVDPAARPKSAGEVGEQLLLDGLLLKHDFEPPKLADCLHHHLWSYNTSFVRQELRRPDCNYLIRDHDQNSERFLFPVIVSHFKCQGYLVTSDEEKRVLTIAKPGEPEFHLTLEHLADQNDTQGWRHIDYPELDSPAFKTILAKLFTGELDDEVVTWLYRQTAGNVYLLEYLLQQLEESGWVDSRTGAFLLTKDQLFSYLPPAIYFELLQNMVPQIPVDLKSTVEFLAADKFDTPVDLLLDRGVINGEPLQQLARLGILSAQDFRFAKSYYQEFIYQQTPEPVKRELHSRWAEIIPNLLIPDSQTASEQLFYHLAKAQKTQRAVAVALDLATQLGNAHQTDIAMDYLRLARTLPHLDHDISQLVTLMLKSAEFANSSGDFKSALSYNARAVRLGSRINDKTAVAEAYKKLGDVFKGRRDYRRGNKALDKAVKLYGDLGNELELSHCFNNIGNIYWIDGDLEKAEFNYETALEVQRNLGAQRDIASSLSNLGTIKCVQQKFLEGIKLFEESIKIKREIADLPELARTTNNIAVAYLDMDELQTAGDYLTESHGINLSLGAERELLYNFENFYEIEVRRGNFKAAREWVFAALKRCRPTDHSPRCLFTILLANLFLQEGRYGKAGNLLALASRLEQLVTDRILSMKLSAALSEYYLLLFDFSQANKYLGEAVEHAEKLGEHKIKAQLLLLKGRIMKMSGVDPQAIDATYDLVDRILYQLPIKREMMSLLLEKLDFNLLTDDPVKAQKTLGTIQNFPAFDGINSFQARTSLLTGMLELRQGNLRRAVTVLNDAALASRTLATPETAWRSLVSLGEVYHGLREYERALKSYIEAFEILRGLASGIGDPQLRRRFLADPAKIKVAEKLEEMTALAT